MQVINAMSVTTTRQPGRRPRRSMVSPTAASLCFTGTSPATRTRTAKPVAIT
jgi:hypothetical protein